MDNNTSDVMCNDAYQELYLSLMGIIQIYTDKTAPTLNNRVLFTYPIRVVLLNFTSTLKRYITLKLYTLVVCLRVEYENDTERKLNIPATAYPPCMLTPRTELYHWSITSSCHNHQKGSDGDDSQGSENYVQIIERFR